MNTTVDARGRTCPQPVVMTLKALAGAQRVVTIVDNEAAVENVTRLARSKGFDVVVARQDDGIRLTLTREGAPVEDAPTQHVVVCSTATAPTGSLVLFVPSDCMGRGAAELGERLMGAFFNSLHEIPAKPTTIVFMNAGVKLAVEGSRALDDIRTLADQGIHILACGTCLDYYGLADKLAVGQVSNMYDIATVLLEAGRIVEL